MSPSRHERSHWPFSRMEQGKLERTPRAVPHATRTARGARDTQHAPERDLCQLLKNPDRQVLVGDESKQAARARLPSTRPGAAGAMRGGCGGGGAKAGTRRSGRQRACSDTRSTWHALCQKLETRERAFFAGISRSAGYGGWNAVGVCVGGREGLGLRAEPTDPPMPWHDPVLHNPAAFTMAAVDHAQFQMVSRATLLSAPALWTGPCAAAAL